MVTVMPGQDTLIAQLRAGTLAEKCAAAARLATRTPPTPAVLDALLAALHDRDTEPFGLTDAQSTPASVASSAADALVALGAVAVPGLLTAALDRDPFVRTHALVALRDLGPRATSALPELLDRVRDVNTLGRDLVVEALGSIARHEPDRVVTAITAVLGDSDPAVVRSAAFTLGALGAAAREALPALERVPERARDAAAHAIWRITHG